MARILVCLVVLLTVALAIPHSASSAAPDQRTVVAYYVPWDSRSWYALEANPGAIDLVAAQWMSVDPCGGISSQDDQTLKQFARGRGISVFPTLVTFSGWLNHRLLTEPDIRERLLRAIVDYVVAEDYEGFDLDLEGVEPGDRAAYTAFVESLASALHERGKRLSLALGPKPRDLTTGWSGAYDYAALGQHADLITIMTYEYSGPWGDPGPIAPAPWVDDVIAFATSQIPPEKVLLGVAHYGYDWNTVTGQARPLGYLEAAATAERYGLSIGLDGKTQSGTFSYQAPAGAAAASPPRAPAIQHAITARTSTGCDVAQPPPQPTRTPRPSSPPGTPEDHVVWIEESASARARLQIAQKYGTGGIGMWRLGQDDPALWPILNEWRASGR
jgi:spore germination protein YaaH